MKVILRILKEVVIITVIIILLLLVGYLLFKNQYTFLFSDVPSFVYYNGIEASDYDVQGNLEDQKDPTKTYQNNQSNLQYLEESRRVHTGTPNPFSSSLDDDNETDLPTEKVDIQNYANPTEEDEFIFSGDEDIDYSNFDESAYLDDSTSGDTETTTTTESATSSEVNSVSGDAGERSLEG